MLTLRVVNSINTKQVVTTSFYALKYVCVSFQTREEYLKDIFVENCFLNQECRF